MVVNSYKNAVIMFFSLCNWTKVFCWYSGHKSAGLWRQEWVNAIPEVTHSVAVLWDIHTTTRNTEMVLVITLFSSMYQQSSCTVFNIWFRAMVSGWQPVKTYELHSLKSVGNQAISYNFAGIKISGKKGPLPFCWNISTWVKNCCWKAKSCQEKFDHNIIFYLTGFLFWSMHCLKLPTWCTGKKMHRMYEWLQEFF